MKLLGTGVYGVGNKSAGAKEIKCFTCGTAGHKAFDCPTKGGGGPG
jgi:hypothetical protein